MKKLNDFSTFNIEKISEITDLDCRMYLATHKKTGARLLYLDREDNNKTFAIAFPTPPEDDTGVFHIIEHSVLCGSEKFPLKDPFVELLKGSLNTFLNAFTYEDRTVYPVSSRCDKDFYNLTNVYLDAVFHPLMLKNENVFLQEGWHYAVEDGALTRNGVVYNEMKGAYSSADELEFAEVKKSLFPNSCYRHDSGGVPQAIPSLTYERFKQMHGKYYHPSNAYIFLDGCVDLETIIPLIDSYLSEFEKTDINVVFSPHAPVHPPITRVEYEASEAEGDADKVRYVISYVYSDVSDRIKDAATQLLADALAGSNEAPLKKALLDSGLCDDLLVSVNRARQNTVVFEMRGVEKENVDKLNKLVSSTFAEIIKTGIDRERLGSTLNNIEFKQREKDYGAFPKGVAFACDVYECWIYGIDPAAALNCEWMTAELRRLMDGDFYERTLNEMTLENQHTAQVVMIPSLTLADRRAAEQKAELEAIAQKLGETGIKEVERRCELLRAWQEAEESEEALASIPTLEISDIPEKPDTVPTVERKIGNCRVLEHPIRTGGITYAEMHFMTDLSCGEDIHLASVLCALLKKLPTEDHETKDLQNLIKANLGSFGVGVRALGSTSDGSRATAVVTVSASALDSNRAKLIELVSQVLTKTDFSRVDVIRRVLVQIKTAMEDALAADSMSFAISRVSAATGPSGIIKEYSSGYESYLLSRKMLEDLNADGDGICRRLCDMAKRIFTSANLVISTTGDPCHEFEEQLIDIFPKTTPSAAQSITPFDKCREGMAIPSAVGYAVIGGSSEEAKQMTGQLKVARSILSYDYLWNEIRVKGGAYGTGFITDRNGGIGFYSYRDPSPMASLLRYAESSDYLRRLADSGEDLTKFIIGAMGEYDILSTPRTAGSVATWNLLSGWTEEKELALRSGLLRTSSEDLRRIADIIDAALADASVCVAANKSLLESEEFKADRIIEI